MTYQINQKKNTNVVLVHLMKLVFEKAAKDSGKNNANGLSIYLNHTLNDKISERSLTRYFNGYVLGKTSKQTHPDEFVLDILSKYLGFENYQEFEKKFYVENENLLLKEEIKEINAKLKRALLVGGTLSLMFFLVSVFYINKYYQKNCMMWVDDHYEKIRCSGLENERKLEPVLLKQFKKVLVCKDSTFFKDGQPRIHYIRHNNTIEFYTHAGEHPTLKGKFTSPITTTIIESRVQNCN